MLQPWKIQLKVAYIIKEICWLTYMKRSGVGVASDEIWSTFLIVAPRKLSVHLSHPTHLHNQPSVHLDLLGFPFLTVLVLDLRLSLSILQGKKEKVSTGVSSWKEKFPLLETVASSCSFIFHWFWLGFMLTPNFAARKWCVLIGWA